MIEFLLTLAVSFSYLTAVVFWLATWTFLAAVVVLTMFSRVLMEKGDFEYAVHCLLRVPKALFQLAFMLDDCYQADGSRRWNGGDEVGIYLRSGVYRTVCAPYVSMRVARMVYFLTVLSVLLLPIFLMIYTCLKCFRRNRAADALHRVPETDRLLNLQSYQGQTLEDALHEEDNIDVEKERDENALPDQALPYRSLSAFQRRWALWCKATFDCNPRTRSSAQVAAVKLGLQKELRKNKVRDAHIAVMADRIVQLAFLPLRAELEARDMLDHHVVRAAIAEYRSAPAPANTD